MMHFKSHLKIMANNLDLEEMYKGRKMALILQYKVVVHSMCHLALASLPSTIEMSPAGILVM